MSSLHRVEDFTETAVTTESVKGDDSQRKAGEKDQSKLLKKGVSRKPWFGGSMRRARPVEEPPRYMETTAKSSYRPFSSEEAKSAAPTRCDMWIICA